MRGITQTVSCGTGMAKDRGFATKWGPQEENGEMRERGLTGALLLVTVLTGPVNLAAQLSPDPPPPPVSRKIVVSTRPVIELIGELEASSFARRRRATRELYRAGATAAVPLGRAARGDNLEVAARAVGVLERMYIARDLEVVAASEEVLEGLVETGPRGVARRARKVLESHVELRQRRAVEQVRRLGGIFKDAQDNVVDPNNPKMRGTPIVTLQLGKGWKGGDQGLRFVRRLTRLRSLLIIDGVKASEKEVTALIAAVPMLSIVRRGRALLGIKAFSMPCQVQEVRRGLAADRAGIKVGDEILKFDGRAIADFQQLVDLIKDHRPGDKVPMTVKRTIGGEKKVVALTVTLDSWESVNQSAAPPTKK